MSQRLYQDMYYFDKFIKIAYVISVKKNNIQVKVRSVKLSGISSSFIVYQMIVFGTAIKYIQEIFLDFTM
jgi:hypothetical protein